MFTLDPVKLLIIGVVAVIVLGPEKLPGAARKVSSLLADLQRLRTSLHDQVHETVGGHPLVAELQDARRGIDRARAMADPRQALYRSIGLQDDALVPDAGVGDPASGPVAVPGAVDLVAVDLVTVDRPPPAAVSPDAADPSYN